MTTERQLLMLQGVTRQLFDEYYMACKGGNRPSDGALDKIFAWRHSVVDAVLSSPYNRKVFEFNTADEVMEAAVKLILGDMRYLMPCGLVEYLRRVA